MAETCDSRSLTRDCGIPIARWCASSSSAANASSRSRFPFPSTTSTPTSRSHRLTDGLRVEGGNIGYGVRPDERGKGYATEILRHTLHEAKAVGLTEALLTCAREKTASARTILRCGGELRSEAYLPERGEIVQRCVIALQGSPR